MTIWKKNRMGRKVTGEIQVYKGFYLKREATIVKQLYFNKDVKKKKKKKGGSFVHL